MQVVIRHHNFMGRTGYYDKIGNNIVNTSPTTYTDKLNLVEVLGIVDNNLVRFGIYNFDVKDFT